VRNPPRLEGCSKLLRQPPCRARRPSQRGRNGAGPSRRGKVCLFGGLAFRSGYKSGRFRTAGSSGRIPILRAGLRPGRPRFEREVQFCSVTFVHSTRKTVGSIRDEPEFFLPECDGRATHKSFHKKKKVNKSTSAENTAEPDKILYDKAHGWTSRHGRAGKSGRLKNLQTLINTRYPDSDYLAKAKTGHSRFILQKEGWKPRISEPRLSRPTRIFRPFFFPP